MTSKTTTNTATFIRDLSGYRGTASLYKLDPPLESHEHVIVSAISEAFDTGRPETYIFPADADGKLTDWGELKGSYQGDTDHARALKGAGYDIAEG